MALISGKDKEDKLTGVAAQGKLLVNTRTPSRKQHPQGSGSSSRFESQKRSRLSSVGKGSVLPWSSKAERKCLCLKKKLLLPQARPCFAAMSSHHALYFCFTLLITVATNKPNIKLFISHQFQECRLHLSGSPLDSKDLTQNPLWHFPIFNSCFNSKSTLR